MAEQQKKAKKPVGERKSVQTFGKKKKATAIAICREGHGTIRVNGCPLALVEPEILRHKVFEPIRLIGADKFEHVDIRIRVRGGGHVSQIYAIRQAISKSIVAYYQVCTGLLASKFKFNSYSHLLSSLSL